MIVLTIPKIWISKNKPGRLFPPTLNARLHWATRSRWTNAFKEAVWAELNSHGNKSLVWQLIKNRKGKAQVTIIFFTCRPMDKDNMYGAAKPLLDALKGQVILDDSPDKLTLNVEEIKVKHLADQKIEIRIFN